MIRMGLQGTLYVVATPIGNLGDITFRAIEVLKEADIVVAESTARAMKLFSHYGIKKTIVTVSSYNEERRSANLVKGLKAGKNVALITSAGTPCISDPGSVLVSRCIEAGIDVCPRSGTERRRLARISLGPFRRQVPVLRLPSAEERETEEGTAGTL